MDLWSQLTDQDKAVIDEQQVSINVDIEPVTATSPISSDNTSKSHSTHNSTPNSIDESDELIDLIDLTKDLTNLASKSRDNNDSYDVEEDDSESFELHHVPRKPKATRMRSARVNDSGSKPPSMSKPTAKR
jgi:hypothetical protein